MVRLYIRALFLYCFNIYFLINSTLLNKKTEILRRKIVKGNQVFEIKLFNFKNEQYYGEVDIGVPSQKFNVIFDTGSNFLWVKGSNCKFESFQNHSLTELSQIKSLKNKNKSYFYIKYGTGSIVGQPITDYFSLGKETYFNKNMSFGITLYEDSKVFSNVKLFFF